MERNHIDRMNEIIGKLSKETKRKINDVMRKHFIKMQANLQQIFKKREKNKHGGNRKRSNLKRIMKNMSKRKRIKL